MPHHSLMFGWEYPPRHLGGLGIACQGLVRGLLRRGARVTLVLPQGDAEMEPGLDVLSPTEEFRRAVRVRSSLQPYDSCESFAERRERHGADLPLYANDLGAAVHEFTELAVRMTEHAHPTVVHGHDWMTFAAGRRAALHHRVPFVAQIHATELDRTHFRPNEWIYRQERKGLETADHIIAVSNYTKEMLVREYGINPDKIDVVHNAVNQSAACAPDGAQFCAPRSAASGGAPRSGVLRGSRQAGPLVLFLGRLTVQKGPFHFLEAARIVHEFRPSVRFVIAGEGYLMPELINRSCAMGLNDSVLFAGNVNANEAQELYRHASCFVMPSLSEPFGLVALEAISHGAPVILSKQSGAREVIPHSFHVDFWDIDKLADCILTVLREEPLAMQLRSEAPRALTHLTWENQAGKVLSIYDKVRTHF